MFVDEKVVYKEAHRQRERVVLVRAEKGDRWLVRTEAGEEITCRGVPAYRPGGMAPGGSCLADVLRRGERAVEAVFKGWV